jgi:hypothetical protein
MELKELSYKNLHGSKENHEDTKTQRFTKFFVVILCVSLFLRVFVVQYVVQKKLK